MGLEDPEVPWKQQWAQPGSMGCRWAAWPRRSRADSRKGAGAWVSGRTPAPTRSWALALLPAVSPFLFCAAPVAHVWRFPGQGSNWSCSCRPRPQPQRRWIGATPATYTTAQGNARPLTH